MLKFSNSHENIRKGLRQSIKNVVRLHFVSFVFVGLPGSYEIYDAIWVVLKVLFNAVLFFGSTVQYSEK